MQKCNIKTIFETLICKLVFYVAVYTVVLALLLCVSGVNTWHTQQQHQQATLISELTVQVFVMKQEDT